MHVSTNKIGLIHLRRGEFAEAMEQFRRSLGLLERYAVRSTRRGRRYLTDYDLHLRPIRRGGQALPGGPTGRRASRWMEGRREPGKGLLGPFVGPPSNGEPVCSARSCQRRSTTSSLVQRCSCWLGDLAGAKARTSSCTRRPSLKACICEDNLAAGEPGDVEESRRNVGAAAGMLGHPGAQSPGEPTTCGPAARRREVPVDSA